MSVNIARGIPKLISKSTPDIDNQYKYLNLNRFKQSWKAMRNDTLNNINNFNVLREFDFEYDTTNPKLKTDASSSIKFDTSKETESGHLPESTIEELYLLQQPQTCSPFDEYDISDKKQTNDIRSNTDSANNFSSFLLPITDPIQSDVNNEYNWLTPLSTNDADVSLESEDISLTNHFAYIDTDNANIVTESGVVWPDTLSTKYEDIFLETKDVLAIKYTGNSNIVAESDKVMWPAVLNTKYKTLGIENISSSIYAENIETDNTSTVKASKEAVWSNTKDKDISFDTKDNFFKHTDNIEADNNIVLTTITANTNLTPKLNLLTKSFKDKNKINHKKNKTTNTNKATHKTKQMSDNKTVDVYVDELLDSKNYNIQKHPSKGDHEEVVIYMDDEFRNTQRDDKKTPNKRFKSLKWGVNFIATKLHDKKRDKTVKSMPYTKKNKDIKADLKQCSKEEGLKLESFQAAYYHKSTKQMLPITKDISFKPSDLESGNDLKTKGFRRKRDIKSIDFDIEKEIKGLQVKNINDFTKSSKNKSSTSTSSAFSGNKKNTCRSKDPFSIDKYNNMLSYMGSNESPKFPKIKKVELANTDKGTHRVKRNAQSYTVTTPQISKTDLDPSFITQKSETAQLDHEIQNLTTSIQSEKGKHGKDFNAKQTNIADFFQMISEWFRTLAGVPQLNNTDPK